MNFVLYALAVWRVSAILVREEGPFRSAFKLREAAGIQHGADGGPISWPDWNPLHCILCTSVWVAAVLWLVPTPIQRVFAASAVAALIEGWIDGD